jgi:exonuclease V gamma subunit
MVPDIDSYAPHIRAVFGQLDRHDPRFIPSRSLTKASVAATRC